jgi:hypothetical protein
MRSRMEDDPRILDGHTTKSLYFAENPAFLGPAQQK